MWFCYFSPFPRTFRVFINADFIWTSPLDSPKGHVDPGEDDMQTALRETEEEAGFKQEDLKIFPEAKQELIYNVQGKPKTVIYWLAELIKETRDVKMSDEHQAFAWLTIEDACKRADYQEMQQALRSFDKYINENLL